jgi:hypothetical protein
MNPYIALQQTLEIFLKSEIQFVFRGTSKYASIKPFLPLTWQNALSSDTSASQIIPYLWKNSLPLFEPFYQHLQERVIEIAIVITPSDAYFAYIFHNDNGFFTFLGGMPTTTEGITSREKELGFKLPLNYQKFLLIHNGFLLDGWSSLGIKPLHKLYTIGEMIGKDIIASGQPINYDPYRLLCFCGDGGGNERCFNDPTTFNYAEQTVFWDHETREISHPIPFERFLEEFLRQQFDTEY